MAQTEQDRLDTLVLRVKKVRRWLVTLAVLRVAALCLIFVSAYIGVYAWLDHRFNFDQTGRIAALFLLIAGLAVLVHRLTKLLLGHISCSAAANYIENKQSFDQQLVTAIEYYENKQDYPYSSALAEQLVFQVEKDSAEYRFDATVQKWQGYVLGAIISFGLVVAWFYVKDNYVYFASYLARLTRPLASVKALSPTHLKSVTKDIVAEPDSEVLFAAEIDGRMPESGELVVVSLESESAEDTGKQEGGTSSLRDGDGSMQAIPKLRLRLPPIKEGQTTRLEASRSFSQPGQFKYRFETESTSTPWHTLNISPAPEIESMTAQVMLPRKPPGRKWIKPYTESIENNTLEVVPGSHVTLNVHATDKLKKVVATDLDGKPMPKRLAVPYKYKLQSNPHKHGSVRFDLVNEQGLANNDLPGLEVIVKTDEPPKFELLSPEGDYLATDVASVPVSFKVTDDFGLESVEMCLEIPGQKPAIWSIPVEEGIRSIMFTHTIELEEYNLSIGDSILFHASATDIDTGSTPENRTSSSEMYFIEIRPCRQQWHPKSGGKPSPNGMPAPVELLNILEYTRAIVKKTWAIAEKPDLTDQDRSALESIDNDVRYCAEQLALIRDDSDYGWQEPHKAVLNTVIRYYHQASQHLARNNAASAMAPEKNAYRILRKFILESELELNPPPSGQSPPQEKPDSVKLQERPPEYAEMEPERIESELQQMQQKLDKLTKEQEILKRTFKNFLEKQAENKQSAQKTTSQEASNAKSGEQDQDKAAENQQGQASSGQKGEQPPADQESQDSQSAAGGQSGSEGQTSSEGKSASGSPGTDNKQSNTENESTSNSSRANDQQSATEGQSPSGEQGSEKSQSATGSSSAERPRVQQVAHPTEEKQSVTQGQSGTESQAPGEDKNASSSQSPGQGGHTSESQDENQTYSGSPTSMANTDLRLRMLQAKQRALQEQVSQLKRDLQQLPQTTQSNSEEGRDQAQKHLDEALEKMDDFQARLTESRYQAQMDARQSSEALETMEDAKRQMDLAQKAIENELTWTDDQRMANEAQEMAEQLAADADAFDESVTEAEREDMLARLEAAKRLLEMMPEPQWAQVGKGRRNSSSPTAVLTKNPNLAPAEAARQMARQFWSIALNAKKRRQQLVEDESSDVKFYGQENEFFENAAKFESEPVQK